MGVRIFTPEETRKAMAMAQSPYRPPEVAKLNEEIENLTKLAEFRLSVVGFMDEKIMEICQRVVFMKLEKDRLYAAWIDRSPDPIRSGIILGSGF